MDQTCACSKSSRAALAWTKKKHSLRNNKLKVNRASDTEEPRKESLRIRRENEKIENHEKQRLVTLKRLNRGDDNELKRNLRLEKVDVYKQLRGRGDRRRKKNKTRE